MGEQVVLHEVAVALVMLRIEPAVLVQVETGHVLEAQRAGLAILNQAAVQADGGRARGQTQHAIRMRGNVAAYHARGRTRHSLVVLGDDEFHGKPLSLEPPEKMRAHAKPCLSRSGDQPQVFIRFSARKCYERLASREARRTSCSASKSSRAWAMQLRKCSSPTRSTKPARRMVFIGCSFTCEKMRRTPWELQ